MRVYFPLIKAGSGLDVWTQMLAKHLRRRGVEAEVEDFPHLFQGAPHFLKVVKRNIEANIIHCNSWSGFAFKKTGIPLVVTEHLGIHDPLLTEFKSIQQKMFHKLVYHYERKSFSLADKIVCVSEYTRRITEEIFDLESTSIHNGIDTEVFCPKQLEESPFEMERGKTILLFVGNMTRRKGVDLLPRIMDRLSDEFLLICVAGNRERANMEHKRIRVVDSMLRGKLVDYYNSSDIFLFPSRLEGLSLAALEAMACGKPVISSSGYSMPELVIDGKGGFLCEGEDVDEYVSKIEFLTERRDLLKEMGGFNRKRVESYFSLEYMANKYIEVYEKILSKQP
ncbi:glycosyltransferase family 4 protein [Oligoflexia bacterium]|nr:glycosyltransferase family 4 protein [Oligoflexia bacterium]